MMGKSKKLIIIDGHAIIHRAWHALPPLKTSKGFVINAVYGFTTTLFKTLKDLKPDYLVVAFDFNFSFGGKIKLAVPFGLLYPGAIQGVGPPIVCNPDPTACYNTTALICAPFSDLASTAPCIQSLSAGAIPIGCPSGHFGNLICQTWTTQVMSCLNCVFIVYEDEVEKKDKYYIYNPNTTILIGVLPSFDLEPYFLAIGIEIVDYRYAAMIAFGF